MPKEKRTAHYSKPVRILCLIMSILVASGFLTYVVWFILSLIGRS